MALSNSPGAFRGKTVFVGNKPKYNDPTITEEDKFCTPYTRWGPQEDYSDALHGGAVGGVEILATSFLNLMNGDWLRRPSPWVEAIVLIVAGTLLGFMSWGLRPLAALGLGASVGLFVPIAAILLSYFTNFWFPWLIVVGAQLPCALAWPCWLRCACVRRERQPARFCYRFRARRFSRNRARGKPGFSRSP